MRHSMTAMDQKVYIGYRFAVIVSCLNCMGQFFYQCRRDNGFISEVQSLKFTEPQYQLVDSKNR